MNSAIAASGRNRVRASSCLIAFVCAGCLSASPASAQSGNTPPISYTDLSHMLLPRQDAAPALQSNPDLPQASGSNFSTIDQRGANNSATADIAGFANRTIQFQSGVGDSSAFTVVGNQNTLTTVQHGSNDHASISVIGQNNRITDIQIGSNLTYGLQQTGNGANVTVQQIRR